jgi:hypothetical protein
MEATEVLVVEVGALQVWVVLVWAAKDTEVEMGCLVLMAAVAEEDVVVWVAVLHQLTEVMVEMGVLTQSQALP